MAASDDKVGAHVLGVDRHPADGISAVDKERHIIFMNDLRDFFHIGKIAVIPVRISQLNDGRFFTVFGNAFFDRVDIILRFDIIERRFRLFCKDDIKACSFGSDFA